MRRGVCVGIVLAAAVRLLAADAELETSTWQAAIDKAAAAGGGRVSVPAGRHLVGQLYLKSNVELHLEEGAVLEGAPGMQNYTVHALPFSEGTWSAVVMGLSVTNVAITGKGTVFGNGTAWPQPEEWGGNQEGRRPRGIVFANAQDVRLEGFLLRDAACWGIVFKCCDRVTARRVRIDSHANGNNDGFDIEASNALFEHCDVDSADDAFVLKSNDPNFAVTNVTVRDSVARTHCCALKLGTASHGVMSDVRFERVRVGPPSRDFTDCRRTSPRRGLPFWGGREGYGDYPAGVGVAAIAVECVDGGAVERVTYDGIEIDGVMVPVFVRGGTRTGRWCGTPPNTLYRLSDIAIRNVRGKSASAVASSITGVEGCRVRNVALENVEIVCRGAGAERSRAALEKPVPNCAGDYPEATMFNHILPAYGLYADRADGLVLKNVRFTLRPGDKDLRPALCGCK